MIAECYDSETYADVCNTSATFWRAAQRRIDRWYWDATKEERAELLRAHAQECRCRDLSVLYRDTLPRDLRIRKPVLIRFQPMWSARRWRSVT